MEKIFPHLFFPDKMQNVIRPHKIKQRITSEVTTMCFDTNNNCSCIWLIIIVLVLCFCGNGSHCSGNGENCSCC